MFWYISQIDFRISICLPEQIYLCNGQFAHQPWLTA